MANLWSSIRRWIFGDCTKGDFAIFNSIPEDVTWPMDVFPTKNGGHTYLSFYSNKGVVRPAPSENFALLPEDYAAELVDGFKSMGYKFEER